MARLGFPTKRNRFAKDGDSDITYAETPRRTSYAHTDTPSFAGKNALLVSAAERTNFFSRYWEKVAAR